LTDLPAWPGSIAGLPKAHDRVHRERCKIPARTETGETTLLERALIALMLASLVGVASGCNTIAGAGKDIERGGQTIRDAAKDVQRKM
jgi:entericidin B